MKKRKQQQILTVGPRYTADEIRTRFQIAELDDNELRKINATLNENGPNIPKNIKRYIEATVEGDDTYYRIVEETIPEPINE